MYNYFVELMGVVVLTYGSLLTDGDPIVMPILYLALYTIGKGYTDGFFNPLFVISKVVIGRMSFSEGWNYLVAQLLGVLATIVTFMPVKTFMDVI
jgi:glycerol uptake facilitator-like aquaporin